MVARYVVGFSSFSYTFVSSNLKDRRKSWFGNFVCDVIFYDLLCPLSPYFGPS